MPRERFPPQGGLTALAASRRQQSRFPPQGLAIASSSLLTDLIATYKMEEASGTRFDAGPNGHDLFDNNTVTQAVGIIGNCGQFTSANSEYLSLPDTADFRIAPADPWSMTFWVRADSFPTTVPYVCSKSNVAESVRDFVLFYRTVAGAFRFVCNAAVADATTFGALALNTFVFVACTYDPVGNVAGISVNDGAVDTGAGAGNPAGSDEMRIGNSRDGSARWDGRIDIPSFWRKVLTAAEITALYNAGSGLEHPF